MIARVTFSNYPYAGDPEPRCDETFDFVFPGLHFDAARNDFVTRTRRQVRFRSPRYTRIFHTPVTSSSRTRKSFCLNAAVRSPPYWMPPRNRGTADVGCKSTTIGHCRIYSRSVSKDWRA